MTYLFRCCKIEKKLTVEVVRSPPGRVKSRICGALVEVARSLFDVVELEAEDDVNVKSNELEADVGKRGVLTERVMAE